jgi:putative heme transporter
VSVAGAAPNAASPVEEARRRPGRLGGMLRSRRRLAALLVFAVAIGGFVYFVVPQLSGVSGTVHRLRSGNPGWLGLAVGFEALSLGSYILLFRTVFSCHGVRIGWKASYDINMAGVGASKLLAAAGAGGVALTVWALRASGLDPRSIARRMLTFELMLYAVYAGALVVGGAGLRTGVLAGQAPWTLTVIPAVLGASAIALTLAIRPVAAFLKPRVRAHGGGGRTRRFGRRLATVPAAVHQAVDVAFGLVRRRELGGLGALGYWTFDVATLWACLHAFGAPPPLAVVVMAYFVGTLANALPLPGGIGGVEGGMIGALLAFGTPGSLAVLGVLSYRAISFWLPTLPGALSYVRLRRTVAGWRAEGAAGPG